MAGVLLAEFETGDGVLAAAEALREKGYTRLDGYLPYPLHGAEEAFGVRRSTLGRYVLAAGLTGASLAYGFQYWMAKVDYDINVGGRPSHAPLSFFPITFEMGVLFAAFAAVITLLAKCGLPRLHHPVFEVEGFERASIDRFWIVVDESDPKFDRAGTETDLKQHGAMRVVWQARGE
jgi:hypothetical protein